MKITAKILIVLLLPTAWAGAQRAVNVSLQAPASGAFTLENMKDLNTEYLDYCAVPYAGGVMFTSARGGKRVFVCDQDLVTGRYSDLYFAKEDHEGRFFLPDMVKGDINSKYHDGAPTFTPDGRTMLLSRNNQEGRSANGLVDLKIYSTQLNRGYWEDLKELPFNSNDFSNCHPSLSTDGNLLYFSSNRPGGYGGMDIYAVKKEGENWGMPINLGPNVNSDGDEIFPFVTASNVLYFSSNGKKGMGGLDVFSVVMNGMEASEPLRLPAPINSEHDDFAFTADKTEKLGYVTSNRPGGKGQDDIYRWTFNGKRPQMANVCVVDKQSGSRLPDASLKVMEAEGTNWSAINLNEAPATNYVVLYSEITAEGTPSTQSCEVKVPVVPGENYYVEVSKDGYQPVRKLVTSRELLANPEYLVLLELARPVNFTGIVRNKNNETPLPGSKVRVLNKCTNQVQELTTDEFGNFDFLLDCRCEYLVQTLKSGFEVSEKTVKSGEINCNELQPAVPIYLKPEPSPIMEVGKVIELENLYYDYDKFNIRSDAAADLDHLVALMKQYPTLEIELGSHTDSRGSDSYNQWLSQQRADAAVRYIISKGIEKRRLTAKGYGETQLVNGCKNGVECDDATHEENRRTEIKITRLEEKGVRY